MNSATHTLARRLLALEAEADSGSLEPPGEVVRVCEKLRRPLAKFLGVDGYRFLMVRALSMAKAETASLKAVQVKPDGSLDGIGPQEAEAAFVVLVNLLALLMTFVGERMTLRLVLESWPDAFPDDTDSRLKGQP